VTEWTNRIHWAGWSCCRTIVEWWRHSYVRVRKTDLCRLRVQQKNNNSCIRQFFSSLQS